MAWFKKKNEPQFELEDYGTLYLNKHRGAYEWHGNVNMSISSTPIELTIQVVAAVEPSQEQIEKLKLFEDNWIVLKNHLFRYMESCFHGSIWAKNIAELQKMYFLIAIDLKRDGSDWWVVLEPKYDVPTIFNHFYRFTIRNNEIIWSNLEPVTKRHNPLSGINS